jgi:uncharacterized coiled-coil DUF342 family protein
MASNSSPTIKNELIDKFAQLRRRRDDLQARHMQMKAKVETARERYAAIMAELNQYGIGSLDELNAKLSSISNQIETELTNADGLLSQIEELERAIYSEEASAAGNGGKS